MLRINSLLLSQSKKILLSKIIRAHNEWPYDKKNIGVTKNILADVGKLHCVENLSLVEDCIRKLLTRIQQKCLCGARISFRQHQFCIVVNDVVLENWPRIFLAKKDLDIATLNNDIQKIVEFIKTILYNPGCVTIEPIDLNKSENHEEILRPFPR